jgi:hypothetical protein
MRSRKIGRLPVVSARTVSSKDKPGGQLNRVSEDGSTKSNEILVQVVVELTDGSVLETFSFVV